VIQIGFALSSAVNFPRGIENRRFVGLSHTLGTLIPQSPVSVFQ
jgi:hypothetical protein